MITYRNQTFYQNQEPILILAGEIHYFRLHPDTWESHLITLKESGCNTVSTYVPWVYHQELEDKLDLTGMISDRLNLVHFLELAKKHDLFVFLRPGPFIMAELKNEGIPYWVYKKHPGAIPKTWDAKVVPTPTLDYLHEGFLAEVKTWFSSLYQNIFSFFQEHGGPIIGIQLDNEVGMLSWVSNAPDLTNDVKQMILEQGIPATLSFDAPSEAEALRYAFILGKSMRERFKIYLSTLKDFWQELGVTQMLYFVNIHGTSRGRAKTFPIGISQLIETYQHNDLIPGTDIYLGNLDLENFHDLYIVNAMMNSTNSSDKPMTSLEFNTSDGNFGDNLAVRTLPSAIDFKIRMSILQNQKMLNYYLFTGGFNPRFNFLKNIDGNDRIAITGERHGFAAPVQPDGKRLFTFDRLSYVTNMMLNMQSKLSLMFEEVDPIYLGFNPDDFMTEYIYPSSNAMRLHRQNLEFHRETVIWDQVSKHLLLLHYRFKTYLISSSSIDPNEVPLLIYATSKYMSHDLQANLVQYHKDGGKLLLVGELPIYNSFQETDTTLIDYFKVSPKDILFDWDHPNLSLISKDLIKGAHEFRAFYAQTIETSSEPLFTLYPSGESVGFKKEGILWVTSNYPGDVNITKGWMKTLLANPGLVIHHDEDALIFSSIQSYQDQKMIHLMNLDHIDHHISVSYHGKDLLDGIKLDLFAQDAYMLPIHVKFDHFEIIYSTAEIFQVKENMITFRLTQSKDTIKIKTNLDLKSSVDYDYLKDQDIYTITVNHHAKVKKMINLYFD